MEGEQDEKTSTTSSYNASSSSVRSVVIPSANQSPLLSLTDFSAGLSALSSSAPTSTNISQQNTCKTCATGELCAHARRGLASAPSQFESIDQETQVLALKTLLKFSSETNAIPTGDKLFRIAQTTFCPIKKAGLLGYLMVRGCTHVRKEAADALILILSGGNSSPSARNSLDSSTTLEDRQNIPLDIRLAAAKAALGEVIKKNQEASIQEIPMMPPPLRRAENINQMFISDIVVRCFYKDPTTSPLITLFSSAANDLGGDEFLLSDLVRRVLGRT